jgi:hypothetical protein
MLDKQMACADLASIQVTVGRSLDQLGVTVVLGHVAFQLLGVGSWRRLPSGLFLRVVEVVGQVLGVRVTNFPSGWEA